MVAPRRRQLRRLQADRHRHHSLHSPGDRHARTRPVWRSEGVARVRRSRQGLRSPATAHQG
ncbi:MAG: hypothetical protein ACK559_31195 [bacterium]